MGDGSVPPHDVFGSIGFDPFDGYPDVIVIYGYGYPLPGPDPKSPAVRIFLGLDLQEWVDVLQADIVASAEGGGRTDPAVYWVKRAATVTRGSRETMSGEFLRGAIVTEEGEGRRRRPPVDTDSCSHA